MLVKNTADLSQLNKSNLHKEKQKRQVQAVKKNLIFFFKKKCDTAALGKNGR